MIILSFANPKIRYGSRGTQVDAVEEILNTRVLTKGCE